MVEVSRDIPVAVIISLASEADEVEGPIEGTNFLVSLPMNEPPFKDATFAAICVACPLFACEPLLGLSIVAIVVGFVSGIFAMGCSFLERKWPHRVEH
ncbi:hypothetical protein Nepgr_002938 [Nepenthes gracilis]|uniref:Uncharacterized protein n=1 Tax=Nepenthes gracilis TaxID=150966 RepID=A0AAD3RY46_NEPGR|nr:hypothetical protein Nepgr_002938 [Nepenthes gracilis]